jgi:hypothetical protein
MGRRIGGFLGSVIFIVLSQTIFEFLYLDRPQIIAGATVSAAVGAFVGNWLVQRHYRMNYLL